MLTFDELEKREKFAAMYKPKWCGSWPTRCDLCGQRLDEVERFADCRLPTGQWAIICERHVKPLEIRFGCGWGQLYSSRTLEKLEG